MCNRILRRPEARVAGMTWLQRGKEGLLDVPLNRSAGGRPGCHGLWEGQGWKTLSLEWLAWVQGTTTGRKYGLEVGLLTRHGIPGGPREWCRVCGSNVRDRHARRPSTVPPGRTAEPQTGAHSRAEKVLISTQWVMAQQRSCRATAGPPRSSDLITCDNSLRGTRKKISQLQLTSVEDLKTATWGCFYVQLSA